MSQLLTQCPTYEIAAYIDGELGLPRELEMDAHFAACQLCARELNQQKRFLCDLDMTLKREGELELPENFTRLIVANAESNVAGLRRPRERYNALFICAALFLFGLFALGSDAGRVWHGIATIFDQIGAVGGFLGRLVYSVFLGFTIILRSFAAPLQDEAALKVLLWSIFAGLLMLISRKVLRIRRA